MPDPSRTQAIPEANYGNPEEHLRRVVQRLNGLLIGRGNSHHFMTLVADETETRLTLVGASVGSVALFSPMTESAAAATVYARCEKDVVILTHDSDPATDRDFGVVIYG